MDKKTKHIFASDQPIVSKNDDLLNRSKFSIELSKSIASWNEEDSLVLAIYGEWGEGKSSVKNMVKEYFTSEESSKDVTILEFNPWQWGDSEKITNGFFKELGNCFKNSKDSKGQELAEKFDGYVEYLKLGTNFLEKFKKLLKGAFATLGTVGLVSTNILESYNKEVFYVSSSFLVFYLLLDFLFLLVSTKATYLNIKFGYRKNMSLDTLKEEIKGDLKEMKSTIVVVLDDIDRLTKTEIRELFKLVKANADFPNIVYLALFQRDIVEKSLDEKDVYRGFDYLKKIVQVGFSLPKVSKSTVYSVLFQKLDELIDEDSINHQFEEDRWNNIFQEGIDYYFKNLRDVNRFISTFTFQLGLLKTKKTSEINFVDLIGMEVLRQYEPETYEFIYTQREVFTKSRDEHFDTTKKYLEALVSGHLEKCHNPDVIKKLFSVLFPNVEWCYSNRIDNIKSDSFVNLHVRHPGIFDRYFMLYLSDKDISKSEFEYVLSITKNKEEFLNYLNSLIQKGQVHNFLVLFDNYKEVVSKADAIPFITALFDISDDLEDEMSGIFYTSSIGYVRRIIHWYFIKRDFSDAKKSIFLECLKSTRGVFLPIDVIHDQIVTRDVKKYPDHYIFEEDDFDELKGIATSIVRREMKNDTLFKNKFVPQILFMWKKIDEHNNVKEWVSEKTQDIESLIYFLEKLLSKSISSSGGKSKTTYRIEDSWLAEFFDDIYVVYNRIGEISEYLKDDANKILIKALIESKDLFENPDKKKGRRL
ncbi:MULTISPECIES: P-loop NTPase fold protein [unclassified Halobacteriovorax]|uniref:KAP family P-loop NTPase fold protein n=1 Tax=unclassified Halobacteriovorax TaxID=2639665 RepID=UPI0039999889